MTPMGDEGAGAQVDAPRLPQFFKPANKSLRQEGRSVSVSLIETQTGRSQLSWVGGSGVGARVSFLSTAQSYVSNVNFKTEKSALHIIYKLEF